MDTLKVLVLCLGLGLGLAGHARARSWDFRLGTAQDFGPELVRYKGASRLFNCDVLIESIDKKDKTLYWVSIWDRFSGKEVGLDIELPKDLPSGAEGGPRQFILSKSQNGHNRVFHWKTDFYGNLASIEARDMVLVPFKVITGIKCAVQL